MKIKLIKCGPSHRTSRSAFTLIEMMISVGIYLALFVGVMVAIQIFGLRIYTLAATKLTATAGARKALNQIRDDIRQAKTLQVGRLTTAGNPTTFTALTGTNLASGTALQIFQTTNSRPYTVYYLDTTNPTNFLNAYVVNSNNVASTIQLVGFITNSVIFQAQDFMGNPVTNNLANNQVYSLTLQFYQWEYPIAYTGTNNALNEYEYYQVRTKVCRRALN